MIGIDAMVGADYAKFASGLLKGIGDGFGGGGAKDSSSALAAKLAELEKKEAEKKAALYRNLLIGGVLAALLAYLARGWFKKKERA